MFAGCKFANPFSKDKGNLRGRNPVTCYGEGSYVGEIQKKIEIDIHDLGIAYPPRSILFLTSFGKTRTHLSSQTFRVWLDFLRRVQFGDSNNR